MSAIITNIIWVVDVANQQEEEELQETQKISRTVSAVSSVFSELEDSPLDRSNEVQIFVEELGSQNWILANKLCDQMIKEMRHNFSIATTVSRTSINSNSSDFEVVENSADEINLLIK